MRNDMIEKHENDFFIKKNKKNNENETVNLNNLPKEVKVSTMTLTCKIKAIFNAYNIGKYLELNDKILSVKSDQNIRSFIIKKKNKGRGKGKNNKNNKNNNNNKNNKNNNNKNNKNKDISVDEQDIDYNSDCEYDNNNDNDNDNNDNKKKDTEYSFYNQVTIVVSIDSHQTNIKLFSNGSIQMTGCIDITNSLNALSELFKEIKVPRGTYNVISNSIEDIIFVDNFDEISIDKIYDLKIGMINSNFNIGFRIDRDKLYELLLKKHNVEVSYEPIIHACVNIKYCKNVINKNSVVGKGTGPVSVAGKVISIFVFESGAIIITGATTVQHIIDAYNFINKILYGNYKKVNKYDILTNPLIRECLI